MKILVPLHLPTPRHALPLVVQQDSPLSFEALLGPPQDQALAETQRAAGFAELGVFGRDIDDGGQFRADEPKVTLSTPCGLGAAADEPSILEAQAERGSSPPATTEVATPSPADAEDRTESERASDRAGAPCLHNDLQAAGNASPLLSLGPRTVDQPGPPTVEVAADGLPPERSPEADHRPSALLWADGQLAQVILADFSLAADAGPKLKLAARDLLAEFGLSLEAISLNGEAVDPHSLPVEGEHRGRNAR